MVLDFRLAASLPTSRLTCVSLGEILIRLCMKKNEHFSSHADGFPAKISPELAPVTLPTR